MYMTLSYVLDLAGAAVNQHVKKECAAKPSMFTVFTVFPGQKKRNLVFSENKIDTPSFD